MFEIYNYYPSELEKKKMLGDLIKAIAPAAASAISGGNKSALAPFYDVLAQLQTKPNVDNKNSDVEENITLHKKPSFKSVLKTSLILSLIVVILLLRPIQDILDKLFKNKYISLAVQTLVFLILALILIKRV